MDSEKLKRKRGKGDKTSLTVHCAEVFLSQFETVGEIFVSNDLILGEFFGISLEKDSSLKKEIGAVGDAERFFDIVVGDEDADVAVFEFPDDILNILNGNRVHAGERFVQHDELRVDGETACNLGSATFATRESVSGVLAYFLKVELGNEALEFVSLIFF